MRTIYINGKFAAQRLTGVQRFAIEVTRALDRVLAGRTDALRFVLLLPPAAARLGLTTIGERTVRGPASLHLWEQVALPWAARRGIVLNLTGTSPLLHPRQVATMHDTAIYDQAYAYRRAFVLWYRLLFRMMARRALLIATTSAFTLGRMTALLRPRGPVVVIGAAGQMAADTADPAIVARLGLAGSRFVLAVGSANPTKNFARLLTAFADVADPDLRLVIVGGGNEAVFAAEAATVTDRVVRAGRVDDAALTALYGAATALVFPSTYEGFGLPPLEAMACGCPVIASIAASIPEVCGDAAVYFDPYDPIAITAAIDRVAGDAQLRDQLTMLGRRRAAHFTWNRSATLLLDAITGLPRDPAHR